MIEVKDLRKTYKGKVVLDGISFQVGKGEIFALLGENGAGKTTTVRILSTLIKSDGGDVLVAGFNPMKEGEKVREQISLTGQYAGIDELLTAEENFIMMGRLSGLKKQEAKKRAAELLTQFDLTHAKERPVKTFSGGMRRRVDIAVSLVANPQVIFLDEPTTGLDPRSRKNMWKLIRNLACAGTTIFLTTQYLEEAEQLADNIAVIHNGRIFVEGTVDELKQIIGEEKIQFTFSEEAISRKAEEIIGGVQSGIHCTLTVTDEKTSSVLRKSLNQLHGQGLEPVDVHVIKPTLDDVFMNITEERKVG